MRMWVCVEMIDANECIETRINAWAVTEHCVRFGSYSSVLHIYNGLWTLNRQQGAIKLTDYHSIFRLNSTSDASFTVRHRRSFRWPNLAMRSWSNFQYSGIATQWAIKIDLSANEHVEIVVYCIELMVETLFRCQLFSLVVPRWLFYDLFAFHSTFMSEKCQHKIARGFGFQVQHQVQQ